MRELIENLLAHLTSSGDRCLAMGRSGETRMDRRCLLQQHAHRGAGSDDAFGAHAGFSETQMQRIIAVRPASDRRRSDPDPAHFRAENNLIRMQPIFPPVQLTSALTTMASMVTTRLSAQ